MHLCTIICVDRLYQGLFGSVPSEMAPSSFKETKEFMAHFLSKKASLHANLTKPCILIWIPSKIYWSHPT